MAKKQTSLTAGVLDKLLTKRLDERFDRFEEHFDKKIDEAKNELRSEFKHLPTKEEYYAREDKTMDELKKLREEVAIVGQHYEDTNKRVDLVEKHLSIDTSVAI